MTYLIVVKSCDMWNVFLEMTMHRHATSCYVIGYAFCFVVKNFGEVISENLEVWVQDFASIKSHLRNGDTLRLSYWSFDELKCLLFVVAVIDRVGT